MEQRLTIITLGVSDIKESEKFYSGVLGWKKTETSNENIIFYNLNGIQFALYPKNKLAEDANIEPEGSGLGAFTLAHNLRSIDEVDALFKYLKDLKVKILKEPQKVFWGGYSGYFADPDGYLWEIAYNPYLELDEKGNIKD